MAPKWPRGPQKAVGSRPKAVNRVPKGHKNVFLAHFGPFWPLGGHFGSILYPQMASGAPKCRGGPTKRGPKGGQQAIKNVFWDRFRPFGYHFGAFPAETENPKIFEILTFWGHFGPFLDPFWVILGPFWTPKWPREPQNAGGNRPKWAKRGSTGHKNVF